MPPPKNSGAPDTSISASQHQTWPPTAPWELKDGGSALSEREGEAQKSKPTIASTAGQQTAKPSITPETAATKPKKSKLRPRKAPIVLTSKAVEQLRGLFDQPEHKMIRVGVKNRGCSGLAYHWEYVDKPGAFDETVEQDGVKVLIDSKALFSIIGSEMDWLEDKLSARFIFKNPNISKSASHAMVSKNLANMLTQRNNVAVENHLASHEECVQENLRHLHCRRLGEQVLHDLLSLYSHQPAGTRTCQARNRLPGHSV